MRIADTMFAHIMNTPYPHRLFCTSANLFICDTDMSFGTYRQVRRDVRVYCERAISAVRTEWYAFSAAARSYTWAPACAALS
jgi:hypothetical protein